jgi:hypothetical protein
MKKIRINDVHKHAGIGFGFCLACAFGFLKIFTGIASVGLLVWLDKYGNYLFLPAYSFFAAVFIGSLSDNMDWLFLILTLAALSVAVYFASFGFAQAGLLVGGFLLGGYSFRWLK